MIKTSKKKTSFHMVQIIHQDFFSVKRLKNFISNSYRVTSELAWKALNKIRNSANIILTKLQNLIPLILNHQFWKMWTNLYYILKVE